MKKINNFKLNTVRLRTLIAKRKAKDPSFRGSKDVAEAIGVSESQFSRWLTNQSYAAVPRMNVIVALATYFEVNAESLLTGAIKKEKPLKPESPLMLIERVEVVLEYTGDGVCGIFLEDECRWTSSDVPHRISPSRASFKLPRLLAEYVVAALKSGLDTAGQGQLAADAVVAAAEAHESALRGNRVTPNEGAG
jgi:transcriptional regulator with XRE-family HTH domain